MNIHKKKWRSIHNDSTNQQLYGGAFVDGASVGAHTLRVEGHLAGERAVLRGLEAAPRRPPPTLTAQVTLQTQQLLEKETLDSSV